MRTTPLIYPTEDMAQHQSALRAYAKRVLLEDEDLAWDEAQAKNVRMREFFAIANAYKCTGKEMVKLLYKGLFG